MSRGLHVKYKTQYPQTQPICFIKLTKTLESTLSEAYNDSCVNGSRNTSNQKLLEKTKLAAVNCSMQKRPALCLPSPPEMLVCT